MDTDPIKQRFAQLEPFLNERLRRLYAATEAQALGYGGISAVARATGVSRQAISHGLTELAAADAALATRIRRPGGGRKRTVTKDATLLHDLEQLVEPLSRGDPESPLRWTCKSVRQLADELNHQGHQVSHELVADLLNEMGYSLQANRKTREGTAHPDRNAQFEHINARCRPSKALGSRSFRWTPRRRNWSGTSRTVGENVSARRTRNGAGA